MNENEQKPKSEYKQAGPPALEKVADPLPPLPERPSTKDLFEALLRRPNELSRHQMCEEKTTLLRFGAIALISILVFGFVLGTFAYGHQLWAAPVKLGGGLFFAALICFPSMYIFASLAGSRASIAKMAGILGGMLAMVGLLLMGFAPALWIFAQGTASLGFMGALVLISWLVALLFAFRFLKTAMRETGATQNMPMVIWSGIFVLVSLQLSTSLRPILGSSEKVPFMTTEKKFFLQHWAETMGESLEVKEASALENSGFLSR